MQAMIKKTLKLALFVASIFCITACSSKEKEPHREPMIEEVNNLPDAEIKIPSTLIGDELDDIPIVTPSHPSEDADTDTTNGAQTPTEVPQSSDSQTVYGEIDEDNNVTYQLDGDTRTQILNDMALSIESSIDTILADKEYYPNISDITVNSDCTEFTIYLTVDKPNLYESTLMMSFYTLGDRYQIYNGIPMEDVKTTVIYINQVTGTELARTDSTTMQSGY